MHKFLFHSKVKLLLIMLLKTISAAFTVGMALVLQETVNMLSSGVEIKKFIFVVLFLFVYIILTLIFTFWGDALTTAYTNRAVSKLRNAFSEKLLTIKYEDFTKNDTAKYISRLTNDIQLLSENYFNAVLQIPEQIMTFIMAVAVAFYINWIVALTMIGLTMLMFIVPAIFNKPLNRATIGYSDSIKDFTRIIKEAFAGIGVVKNFSIEKQIMQRVRASNAKLTKRNTALDRLKIFSKDAGMLVVVMLQVGSIAAAGFMLIYDNITIGAVIAVVQLGNQLFSPIMVIAEKATLLSGTRELSAELMEVFNTPDDTGSEIGGPITSIELDSVSFRYPGEERNVLDNISLRFERGEKYLIVGKSGSGKSTILKLISKMYGKFAGKISFSGVDIQSLSSSAVSTKISSAQQHSYLFLDSLRNNIDIAQTGNAEMLKHSVETADLEKFIDELEEGLDAVVDEEINQVSGGEKLRIGLARALYCDSEVLLLDEVTSALDKESAYRVERNILGLEGKTVINVSHKLHDDLLVLYDKIGIMENGRLLAFGAASEIRETKAFSRFVKKEQI